MDSVKLDIFIHMETGLILKKLENSMFKLKSMMFDSFILSIFGIRPNWNFTVVLTGDFNDIVSSEEKKCQVSVSTKCDIFIDNINTCDIWVVLGAVSADFTWLGPLFNGRYRIFERLDRALCNDYWRLGFADAMVREFCCFERLDRALCKNANS